MADMQYRRRILLFTLAGAAAAPLVAQEVQTRPRHKVSAQQLYEAMSTRFPVRRDLGGLLTLQVSAPALLLLPSRNKVGASLQLDARGPAMPQPQSGELDLVFALRYEASDQTLRALDPEVLDLRFAGATPETQQAVRALLPRLTRDVGEFVLHRFTARELALPETMGFEPGKVTVAEDGIVVEFVPKARP